MSLGLPGHLARDSLSRALVHAGHCAAWVCLGISAIIAVIGATLDGVPAGWTAAAINVVLALILVFVARYPTVTLTLVYLIGGTCAVFVLTVIVMNLPFGFASTDNILLALPRIALILVGGAGVGTVLGITWAALGYGLGEAAAFLGATLTGGMWTPNLAAAAAFGILVIARAYDGATRRHDARQDAGLQRASQQTRELAIRHDYELRATARLHDTALSHLEAIAAAGSGPVEEGLRDGIRRDLGLIVGRDWASDYGLTPIDVQAPAAASVTRSAALENAFSAAANVGLEVRLTGDLAVLGLLGERRAEALDDAVAQCLVNVARHAGVREAEVAVGVSGGEVTVAVMDSGTGFDENEVPQDRIGLRTSIRARIEREGGEVRLWSTRGVGTTVVLTVPGGGE